jgi:hypothetical protein
LKEHKPTDELIKRASAIADPEQRQQVIDDILKMRDRYAGTIAEFKAPGGQVSNLVSSLGAELGQQAWYAVRTPAFKNWFGDWERIAIIENIKGTEAIKISDLPLASKAALGIYRSFGARNNAITGQTAAFVSASFGKIIRHRGFDIRMIPVLGDAYEKAHHAYDEDVIETHKKHPNFSGYSNYVSKINLEDKEYYVRFTLQNFKSRQDNVRNSEVHSAFVSDIQIYSALEPRINSKISNMAKHDPASAIDNKLHYFMNSVNPNSISKIIDGYGEPKPVYRGDGPDRELFANPQGTFFTSEKALAEGYSSGGLYGLFLDMKNPLVLNEGNFVEVREKINDMLVDIYEKDQSELDHDSQYQALRKNYLAFRNGQGSAVRDFYSDFLPKVSEDTDLEDFKEILLKSVHDANAFEWRQIDYHDIDILNPFIQCLGYDGIVRQYDPLGQARGTEYATFDPRQIKSATANAGTYDRDNPSFKDGVINIFIKEKAMADLKWYDGETSAETSAFGGITFLAQQETPSNVEIIIFGEPEGFYEYDIANIRLNVQGDLGTAKKIIDNTITHLEGKEEDIGFTEIRKALNLQIKKHKQSQAQSTQPEVMPTQAQSPSLVGRNNNSKENIMQNPQITTSLTNESADGQIKESLSAETEQILSRALNPSSTGREHNTKENTMSDLSEEPAEDKSLSPRELAFQNAVYQRNMIGAALKNGTLCCLPGKDGYADTAPAMNLANHNFYHGDTLLYLKDHQKKNGFPTGEYLTQAQIEKAREDDVPGLYILKGQKGVSIHVSELNDETGDWDEKHIRLFNVAQLNSPAKFRKWVDDKRLEYFQSQHGAKIQPPEPGQKAKGPEIACSSSDPVKYLGQYFAAVSKGVPFKADGETAKEFAKNMGDSLYNKIGTSPKTGEPVTDPFSLSKICREANKYCKEFLTELKRQQSPEQEQQQSRKGHRF